MTPAGLAVGFRDYQVSVPAAVTKHHRLGLTHAELTVCEAEVQDQGLVRALSRFIDGILLL